MILATDMSKHFEILGTFKSKSYNISQLGDSDVKLETLKLLIHAADIGHSAKDSDMHIKWSLLVSEEFFLQGDIEKSKNIPVSMYCDRETTILSKCQIGFLKNIAFPLYEVLCLCLNSEKINLECLEQLKNNISLWEYEYSSKKLQTLRNIKQENSLPPVFKSFNRIYP